MKLTNYFLYLSFNHKKKPMKIEFIKSLFIAVALGAGISSCSVATKSVEVESASQIFQFEDIYSEENTASLTVIVTDLLSNKVEIGNMESAGIQSITLSKNDSIGLSEINSAKLHIMGEKLPILTVGLITSIDEGAKSVTFEILDDLEIEDYLKAENITLVLDVNYLNDNDNSQKFEVGINFGLEMIEQN